MSVGDGDDLLQKWENSRWDAMLADGHSREAVQAGRDRKRAKEQISMYTIVEAQMAARALDGFACAACAGAVDRPLGCEDPEGHASWDVGEAAEVRLSFPRNFFFFPRTRSSRENRAPCRLGSRSAAR